MALPLKKARKISMPPLDHTQITAEEWVEQLHVPVENAVLVVKTADEVHMSVKDARGTLFNRLLTSGVAAKAPNHQNETWLLPGIVEELKESWDNMRPDPVVQHFRMASSETRTSGCWQSRRKC